MKFIFNAISMKNGHLEYHFMKFVITTDSMICQFKCSIKFSKFEVHFAVYFSISSAL